MGSKPGTPGKDGDQEAFLRRIAASLHVSLTTLENELRDLKMTSGQLGVDPTNPAVVKVFAKDLGISDAKALEVIKKIVASPGKPGPGKPGPGKPGGPGQGGDQEAFLREIAASLHVSLTTLENALRDTKMPSGQLGVERRRDALRRQLPAERLVVVAV